MESKRRGSLASGKEIGGSGELDFNFGAQRSQSGSLRPNLLIVTRTKYQRAIGNRTNQTICA